MLSSFEQPPEVKDPSDNIRTSSELVAILGKNGDWERTYKACVEDLEGECYDSLDT